MKAYRLSKGETEHYTSLEELRAGWGLKPVTKQTKNKSKLEKQRSDFCVKHLCPACKQPMSYSGIGNQLICKNENCKGIRNEQKDVDTGEMKIWYSPAFDLLDERSASIAQNIFNEA